MLRHEYRNRDSCHRKCGSSNAHPEQGPFAYGIPLSAAGPIKSSSNLALAQKSIVVPLDQVSFYLSHGVQDDTHNNQQTRAAQDTDRAL